MWAAMLSVQVLTFRYPKLIMNVCLPCRLIVFQPLLVAVLLHSLCCNILSHTHTWLPPKLIQDVFLPFRFIIFQPLLGAVRLYSLCCNTHMVWIHLHHHQTHKVLPELDKSLNTINWIWGKNNTFFKQTLWAAPVLRDSSSCSADLLYRWSIHHNM